MVGQIYRKTMHLIQILLPLQDNDGAHFPREAFGDVRDTLIEHFGGLTAYTRTPADGVWKASDAEPPARDEIVIYEVMTAALDHEWWKRFRQKLEVVFRQESLVIRANEIVVL